MHEIFPETARVNEHDHLDLGGIDTVELAERFGTPVMLFDRATFEARARSFGSVLKPSNVVYAAKALCCVAVCELVDSLGLGLDVCTGGELATARAANFPMERVVFHGNNKSIDEIDSARDANVGRIVLDSFEEIERVERGGAWGRLLVRATPGVEAHTHEFVQTGQEDSKFGFSLANGIALDAMRRANSMSGSSLVGLHAHIGSQIFELTAFDLAIQRLADLLVTAKQDLGFEASELNLGGGLGVAHTEDELTPDPAESTRRVLDSTRREFEKRGLAVPSLYVEPGRALVGSSMVTLYRVGTVKRIPGVRTYVSVDGGMSDNTPTKGRSDEPPPAGSQDRGRVEEIDRPQTEHVFVAVDGGMGDNIRPPLYGAKYEAFLANRMGDPATIRADVVGRYCESGDFLIKGARLPADIAPGDLLCIPATGAYTYSMASNYNRVPRPAVVMVEEGRATEIIRRETNAELLRMDRHLDGSEL